MMLCKTLEKQDLAQFAKICGDRFIAEEKFDGDRCRLTLKNDELTLRNRPAKRNNMEGADITFRYPELHDFKFPTDVMLDGEMCVMIDGTAQFNEGISHRTHLKDEQKIRDALTKYPVTYVVFDVLEVDGEDFRVKPWTERRAWLEKHKKTLELSKTINITTIYTDILGIFDEIIKRKGEGIIIKDIQALYVENKRANCWKKVKDVRETDMWFDSYEINNAGIKLSNKDDIKVQVSGAQSDEVKDILDSKGKVYCSINHLGDITANGKFRMPTFKKLVVD